nr:putative reverse transcriptase domain, ribonuclease H-like domain protein [Tanacetum cinerariifolium]
MVRSGLGRVGPSRSSVWSGPTRHNLRVFGKIGPDRTEDRIGTKPQTEDRTEIRSVRSSRQMRNNDLRTELEYFSEDYDEEREMEPRPKPARAITPPLNQFRQYAGQNVGNLNEYNDVQNVENQNPNGNGNLVVARAKADLDEIEEVNANCILMANLQQASTSGTQTNKAPVYDSDGSAEVHNYENCYDNEIFNMFTQEEQYTKLLEPIFEPHQVPENENIVISEDSSVEQSGGTVEQHPVNVEETRVSTYGGQTLSNNIGGNLPPNEDYPLPDGLKMPSYIGSYNEKGDPDKFLHLFKGAIRQLAYLVKGVTKKREKTSDSQSGEKKKEEKPALEKNPYPYGFSRKESWPLGEISLEVTIGEGPLTITKALTFVIVRSDSPHNILLGRTAMQEIRIVVSIVHGAIKFHTSNGVGTIFLEHNSQRSKEEEGNSNNNGQGNAKNILSCIDTEEKIVIDDEYPEQKITIARQLPTRIKIQMRDLLRAQVDVFLWTTAHITGVLRTLIIEEETFITEHQLNLRRNIFRSSGYEARNKSRPLQEKALPFMKTLKSYTSRKMVQWTTEANEAFRRMKECLKSLPTMVIPTKGETLIVYLAASERNVSAVLMAERGKKQAPVYFVSQTLHGAEQKYPELEKLILALVYAARKLQRYFQAHPVQVPSDMPIKQVLAKQEKSGRVAKWVIKLGEHEIEFTSRNSIKGRILADFLAETSSTKREEEKDGGSKRKEPEPKNTWKLFTDVASSSDGSRAGLMLVNPEGKEYTCALRFEFKTTNNEAKYEALITGLYIAKEMQIQESAIL